MLDYFLDRNFKDKFTCFKDMRPVSDQSGRLYATAKTQRSNPLDEMTK